MRRLLTAMAVLVAATAAASAQQPKRIAITSFGEHPALQGVVDGFKASMKERGYTEGKDVTITFTHVNWDRNLIPQMLTKVASDKPDVVVTITTPVTQSAVRALTDPATPVVFAAVQDPVVAGVIPAWDKASPNMTGAANLVDMDGTLKFIKEMLPNAKRVGVPFNPGDDADNALARKAGGRGPEIRSRTRAGQCRQHQRHSAAHSDLRRQGRRHLCLPVEPVPARHRPDRRHCRPARHSGLQRACRRRC